MVERSRDNTDDHVVVELCPHCENEILFGWNVEEFGYAAYCPVCGKRLMLCSECQRGGGSKPCDYDSERDACHLYQGSRRERLGQHQRQNRQAARVG